MTSKKILLYMIISIMLISSAHAITTEGINDYYDGDIIGFYDDTLNGTNGSLHSVIFTNPAKLNGGYNFTGGNITFPAQLYEPNEFTLNYWLRCDSKSNNYCMATAHTLTSYTGIGNGPRIFVKLEGGTEHTFSIPAGIIGSGNYHMVTITKDSNNKLRGYLNGTLINTFTDSGALRITLMGNLPSGLFPLNGSVDELLIGDTNFSQQNITDLYNAGIGYNPFGGTSHKPLYFSSPTPSNESNVYLNNLLNINATADIDELTRINLVVLNSSLDVIFNETRVNASAPPMIPNYFNISLEINTIGNYSFIATAQNSTGGNYSTGYYRVFFYNITPPYFIDPLNGSDIYEPYLLNYTEANITENKTTITKYRIELLNLDYSPAYVIDDDNGLNLTKFFNIYDANLSIGLYRLFVEAHDNNGAVANSSIEINLTKNAQLNSTAWYGPTQIQNYTITFTDHVTMEKIQENVTDYLGSVSLINGRTYSVFLNGSISGYADYYDNLTIDAWYDFYNVSLNPSNAVLMRFYNVTDLSKVLQAVTFSVSDSGGYYFSNTTTAGEYLLLNLSPSVYTFDFSSSGFEPTTYYVTVGNNTFQYLDVYFASETSDEVVFTVIDLSSGAVIESAFMSVETFVNGSFLLTNSFYSDVTGRIQFSFNEEAKYRFTLTHGSYLIKQFILDPVIFNSYTVRMQKDVSQNNTFDYSLVSIMKSPDYYYNGATNNISLLFFSPYGSFIDYDYVATVSGTNWSVAGSGSNAYGSTLADSLYILGANLSNKLILTYSYNLSNGQNKTYVSIYSILNSDPSVSSFYSNKDNPYDMSLYDRVFILVIISVIMGGIAMWYGGVPAAGAVIMLVFGYMIAIGFVSQWFGLIPIIILLMLAVRWSS